MCIRDRVPFLRKGDIVIDGGNAHFEDTERRQHMLSGSGIHLVGCGISGGEKGARTGPALMPGGKSEVYPAIAGTLETIAARDYLGKPCCGYIGPGGAGHFVKMVHNGIEYGEMQLLAEVYHLLSGQMPYTAIADLFDEWNKGDLSGYLLEITARILRRREADGFLLDRILDEAGSKGTGGWSVKAALDLGSVNSMMAAAVFARYLSADPIRKRAGVHRPQPGSTGLDAALARLDPAALENAYRFARIMNHQQGFELLRNASTAKRWNLDLAEIARIWTNGCILRSSFMQQCASLLAEAETLLDISRLHGLLFASEAAVAAVLRYGSEHRVPLPALTAAWNDWLSITSGKLPANLVQAQRDFFGAHRYLRKDDPQGRPYHTNWEADD
jgi:6-phosphogluconate dehydrogenase